MSISNEANIIDLHSRVDKRFMVGKFGFSQAVRAWCETIGEFSKIKRKARTPSPPRVRPSSFLSIFSGAKIFQWSNVANFLIA